MNRKEMRALIHSDLDRLDLPKKPTGFCKYLMAWVLYGSFKVTYWYRICSYWHTKKGKLARFILAISNLIYKHYQFKVGVDLPYKTKIGKGLLIMHFGGIVISKDAVIGNNFTIFQCATIGKNSKGEAPTIGDNCTICAGAKVLGGIRLGNNVVAGANAVVLKDCSDNAVVAGVPAKIIRIKE